MAAPKKVKYRKPHRRYPKGAEHFRGNKLTFGEIGLQAIGNSWITLNQIESARVAINRKLKRQGQIWIRLNTDLSLSAIAAESRMGKGKGSPDKWVAVVKKGRIIFEVAGTTEADMLDALTSAMNKLPIKCRIIKRGEV